MDPIHKLIHIFSIQSQNLDQSTQLHILILNSEEFKYSIVKSSLILTKQQKKTFRIKLKPNISFYKENLLQFINKFLPKKLFINLTDLMEQKIQWEILSKIHFQEIRIQDKKTHNQNHIVIPSQKNNSILPNLQKFLTFLSDFNQLQIQVFLDSSKQIINLLEVINKLECKMKENQLELKFKQLEIKGNKGELQNSANRKRKYIFCFNLQSFKEDQLLLLIQQWCLHKVSFCQSLKQKFNLQKTFSTRDKLFCPGKLQNLNKSSVLIDQTLLKKLRNEVITIHIQDQHILSLSSCSEYGYSIRLGRRLSREYNVKRVINTVLNSGYFISLQAQNEGDSVLNIIDFVFQHYHFHSNYLIKIGNQVELTSYRLMLNTKDLPSITVKHILKLLQSPGHYEFIFYGSLDYFQQVRLLFIRKPFTKFNYFLPIEQVSNEISQLINKMEFIAEKFKQKVFQFYSLLKHYSYKEIHLIEDVYIDLHFKDFQDQI